ncbi:ENP1 [Linum perenne]
MRFMDESRIMPLIWHQSLLAFVQRYKNDVEKEDKEKLREKEEDVVTMINKTIEEDQFDIPEVPMEED